MFPKDDKEKDAKMVVGLNAETSISLWNLKKLFDHQVS